MNFANLPPLGPKARTERHTPEERRYYRWIHSYQICCLTGRPDIEICHTGGLTEGKGMSRKAPLRTCLPLAWPLHRAEEANRAAFWAGAGFPDHLAWAERLYDIFEAHDDPTPLFLDMQARADRDFLAQFLAAA